MARQIARFKCPWCREYIFGMVKDTRASDNGLVRKRECEKCGTFFMTKEDAFAIVKKRRVIEL